MWRLGEILTKKDQILDNPDFSIQHPVRAYTDFYLTVNSKYRDLLNALILLILNGNSRKYPYY